MTLHKPFQKQGLSYSPFELEPCFGQLHGVEALAKFLDISTDEVAHIFINLHEDVGIDAEEVTPIHVAEALQQLLIEYR